MASVPHRGAARRREPASSPPAPWALPHAPWERREPPHPTPGGRRSSLRTVAGSHPESLCSYDPPFTKRSSDPAPLLWLDIDVAFLLQIRDPLHRDRVQRGDEPLHEIVQRLVVQLHRDLAHLRMHALLDDRVEALLHLRVHLVLLEELERRPVHDQLDVDL